VFSWCIDKLVQAFVFACIIYQVSLFRSYCFEILSLDNLEDVEHYTMKESASTPTLSGSTDRSGDIPEPNEREFELNLMPSAHLINDVVQSFSWQGMQVTVKDGAIKATISNLDNAFGHVEAGDMIANMGPSGSGKTTLLNMLAHRTATAGATTNGDILTKGHKTTWQQLRRLSAYV
jgi:ABC-type glutathione transport system ATPase component